jgi:MFS family permease
MHVPEETPASAPPSNPVAATWPLLLGMGILMLGAGLQSTELSLRATLEGFSATVTGAVMSSYYLGYLLGTSAAPSLVRRVGHIRVFAALAAVAAASILLQGLFIEPVTWGLLRGISGMCFAGIYVVAESWLNDSAGRLNRGRLLALYMAILYIGLGSSQFLLIPADPRTTAPFMLVALLICLAIVPIMVSANRAPEIAMPRKVSYRELFRDSPLGIVGVTMSGMVTSNVYSMGPVYARLRGLDTSQVASFMGISILAAVMFQYPVGRLSDRLDRRTIIVGVCVVSALSAAALTALPELPRAAFLALTAIFSGFAFTIYSLSVSHVNDHLEPVQLVAASGALIRLNGLGAAISPVLVGALISGYGPRVFFGALASLAGALATYGLWRKARRRPIPARQKRPFIGAELRPAEAAVTCASGAECGGPPGALGSETLETVTPRAGLAPPEERHGQGGREA